MVATLGVSYKSETMLKVIEVLCLSLFFSLLLYGKVLLYVTSVQSTTTFGVY